MRRDCVFSKFKAVQDQHVGGKLCVNIDQGSHLWCKDSNSLWLGIPFGFTHHGEVLIEEEGDERAGRLSCDGGQLLNWATNRAALNPDTSSQTQTLIRWKLLEMERRGSGPQTSGFRTPLDKALTDQSFYIFVMIVVFILEGASAGNH